MKFKLPPLLVLLPLAASLSTRIRAEPSDDGGPGQLTSPIETIPLRHEPDRDVFLRGQHARAGRLVLTPDTCFFHGDLHLAGETTPQYPGAELNGGKSWTRIEGLNGPRQRAVWPVWLPQPATLNVAVEIEVPPAAAGNTFTLSAGDARQAIQLHASNGSTPQPETVSLAVAKPGLYELSAALAGAGRAGENVVLRRLTVTGPGVDTAVLIRSRWRAAAVHAHFSSSALAPGDSRLWVMEVRPLPCEDSMYAPLTTPFGYFGATYEPDGTSGGINFSMWSYGRGETEPPVERLAHLLALGDPRQHFGRFDGEGHGVKSRDWSPLDGCPLTSAVFALRLDPGTPYDTYTGYVLDPHTRDWKFFAAGRHWHADTRRAARGLLPGACRVLVRGGFGSVWSDPSARWP